MDGKRTIWSVCFAVNLIAEKDLSQDYTSHNM